MAGNDDDPLRIGGVSRPQGAAPVDAAAPTEATAAVERVEAPQIDAVARVAESLATGAIDADAALRALIDATASSVLGPGADPAALAAVRAEVEALLAGDPTLASLLRP